EQRVTETVVQGAGCSCSGSTGEGTYTYAYTANPIPPSPSNNNAWATQTVETRPDGNKNFVYTNTVGEVMLRAFVDMTDAGNPTLAAGNSGTPAFAATDDVWVTYDKYDNQGRLLLEAQPSAVSVITYSMLQTLEYDALNASPSNPNPSLPNSDVIGYNSSSGMYQFLNANSGLINLTNYGTTTNATSTTPGDVLGYLKNDQIQDGYTGTLILQDAT